MAENLISGIIPKIGEVSEWSKELPWKGSIPITGIEGSNPSFSVFINILSFPTIDITDGPWFKANFRRVAESLVKPTHVGNTTLAVSYATCLHTHKRPQTKGQSQKPYLHERNILPIILRRNICQIRFLYSRKSDTYWEITIGCSTAK